MSLLKSKQSEANGTLIRCAIVGGIIALYATMFFTGPASIAGSILYSSVAASTTDLAVAGVLGGAVGLGCGIKAAINWLFEGSEMKKSKTPIIITFSMHMLTSFASRSGTVR
jgi:hypothetical protein